MIVNTVHGLYALPEDAFAKRAVVYSLERIAATASHAELVQNPEDIATLRRLRIPADRIHLLGNGIDLHRFDLGQHDRVRREVRDELGIGDDTLVVGAVGRLVLEKGYVELLDAWKQVRAQHPDAQLLIAGPSDPEKADAVPQAMIDAVDRGRWCDFSACGATWSAYTTHSISMCWRRIARGSRDPQWRPPPVGCRSSRPTSAVAARSSTTA